MATNLQVENEVSATAQFVQDQNGNTSPLALSTNAVRVSGNGLIGTIDVFTETDKHTIKIGGSEEAGRIGLGGNGSKGVIEVFDPADNNTITSALCLAVLALAGMGHKVLSTFSMRIRRGLSGFLGPFQFPSSRWMTGARLTLLGPWEKRMTERTGVTGFCMAAALILRRIVET